jgi:hypothetical protein
MAKKKVGKVEKTATDVNGWQQQTLLGSQQRFFRRQRRQKQQQQQQAPAPIQIGPSEPALIGRGAQQQSMQGTYYPNLG